MVGGVSLERRHQSPVPVPGPRRKGCTGTQQKQQWQNEYARFLEESLTLKKMFAPLTAVALVAVVAVSLLGQQRRVEAAAPTFTSLTAPVQAAGLVETWTASFSATGAGALVAGNTVTITFPTGFTIPATPTCSLGGAFGATLATCATAGQVVTVTLGTGSTLANSAAGTVLIQGITNPTSATTFAAGATAGTLATTADTPAGNNAAAISIWNTSATKSPTTSVQADGASTVTVTFTSSATANTGAVGTATQVLTVTTDVGTIPTALTGALLQAATAVTTPVTSATAGAAANSGGNAATLVATIKAPSAAGTSTVILRATPASGGQAVVIGSASITWSVATTQGAPASVTVTSAGNAVSMTQTGTLVITATFLDANGNAPIPGSTIAITTSLGTLTAPTNGTTAGQSITNATVPVGGVFNVTLNGSGVGGPATVTFTVGAVTGNKVISVTGTAAKLELSGRRTNTATSFSAKGVVRNTDSTTASEGQDELFVAGVAKDSLGNVLAAGNVTFTLTGPAGHTLTWAAAAEQLTLTGATCAGGSTVCTDAIQGGAFGDTTPAHAVAVIDVDTEQPVGTYTVTATIPGDNGNITGTMTFTVVKAPATLSIADIGTIGLGASVPVAITCLDADGKACPSGTFINVNVSNANLIAQNPVTGTTGTSVSADLRTNDSGVATINLIGVTAGSTNVVANTGTVTAVKAATVGATTTPAPTPGTGGTFSGGTIAPAGVSIVSFTGTTAQLNTAGATAKAVSVTATVGGKMITFVVGAPDFVNAEFNAAFPTGLSGTLVIVKTGA